MFFFFFYKDEVENFLKQALYSQESLEVDKVFGDYIVDFYLPQGSRKLNFPSNTVIVVKENLTSGVTFHAKKKSKQLYEKFRINSFCLFSRNIPTEAIPLKSSPNKSDIFRLIDFDILKNSISKYGTTVFEEDKQWKQRRDELLNKARHIFSFGRISLFLGAGVSQDAGLSGWDTLLNDMVDQLHSLKEISHNEVTAIMHDTGNSLLLKARYLKHLCNERDISLVDLLRNALYRREVKESQLVNALVKSIETGNVSEVITYNYDDLLERALDKGDFSYSTLDMQSRPNPGYMPIFHVHGFISREKDNSFDKNVVLAEDEYHSLYNDVFHWANLEQLHALAQTTCFFIGLSMMDPNLRRLMDVANERGSKTPEHFAFLHRNEYHEPLKAEEIFYKMGVSVIWYENFRDLPLLINELVNLPHSS